MQYSSSDRIDLLNGDIFLSCFGIIYQMTWENRSFQSTFVFTGDNFMQALQRTIEFEEELAEKFGGGSGSSEYHDGGNETEETDEGKRNNQIVSDIRKKYEKKLAIHGGPGTELVRGMLIL